MSNDDLETLETDTYLNGVAAAIEAGKLLGSYAYSEQERFALHNGNVIDLQDVIGRPPELYHVQETREVHNLPSFITLFNAFAGAESVVIADESASRITGIIDYHCPPAGIEEPKPARKAFKIVLDVKPCTDFRDWMGFKNTPMKQEDFADFIEERARFFVEPKAAIMLEIATTLQATRECRFERSTKLQSGDHHIRYTENTEARDGAMHDMEIPKTFRVALPYQTGGKTLEIDALLRYRIRDGELTFTYKMPEQEALRREHFKTYVDEISGNVSAMVLLGKD